MAEEETHGLMSVFSSAVTGEEDTEANEAERSRELSDKY
jgi:hypothetical protein